MEIGADPKYRSLEIDWSTAKGHEYLLYEEVLSKIESLSNRLQWPFKRTCLRPAAEVIRLAVQAGFAAPRRMVKWSLAPGDVRERRLIAILSRPRWQIRTGTCSRKLRATKGQLMSTNFRVNAMLPTVWTRCVNPRQLSIESLRSSVWGSTWCASPSPEFRWRSSLPWRVASAYLRRLPCCSLVWTQWRFDTHLRCHSRTCSSSSLSGCGFERTQKTISICPTSRIWSRAPDCQQAHQTSGAVVAVTSGAAAPPALSTARLLPSMRGRHPHREQLMTLWARRRMLTSWLYRSSQSV